jgi:RNA polymerase sigma-70 factor, ECF subfamily
MEARLKLIRQRGNRGSRCVPSHKITSRTRFRFTTIVAVTGPDPVIPVGAAARDGFSSLDPESAEWLDSLRGPRPEDAAARLHSLLLRVARREIRRRNSGAELTGPELDDLAHQAAADAVVLITRRVDKFRGESRFTTWAYKFVIFEVSNKLGRHFWTHHRTGTEIPDWDQLPARFGSSPSEAAESRALVEALRAAVQTCLTDRQRDIFMALVVDGIPLDALVNQLSTNRNAVYKVMFDARRKLRHELVARGYIDPEDAP